MNRRTSRTHDDALICKGCDDKSLTPAERELCLHEVLEGLDAEKAAIKKNTKAMRKELKLAQEEIEWYKKKEQARKENFDKDLQFLFFDYLPSHSYNYSDSIGPVDYDICETDATIGIYDIGKFLGEGYYASVHVGTHRRTQQQYALKKLSKHRMVSLVALTQLQKELEVLQSVDHENVIKLHDIIHAPDHIYLILELGHQDLFQYTRENENDLTLDTIRQVAVGVLRGVAYLHERGIAHLDIKVENILVCQNVPSIAELHASHIKLCDLGLCAVQPVADKPIPVGRLCGTPGFFAPEIVFDRRSADGRSADMWSVGATLIEMTEELSTAWTEAYSYYKKDERMFQQGIDQCLVDLYGRKSFPDPGLLDLICRMLVMKPVTRLTANQALDHVWLHSQPAHHGNDGDDDLIDGYDGGYRRRSV